MSAYLHPALLEMLRLDEDFWAVGDPAAVVETESGGRYIVQPDGTVTGGTRQVNGARLNGSVYRRGGPIRTKVIVFGLRMELAVTPGRVCVTSPVARIEEAK